MATQDSSSGDQNQNYLSKRVMINGQFVTLYSANGVTWLSSPEDIPNTMARLDNTRIVLTEEKDGEKAAAEASAKGDKDKEKEKTDKAAPPPPKVQGSQYRMKGPKPRPILRQGGKVVKGTPIEPVSASTVNIKGPADVTIPQVKLAPMEQGLRRGKLIAPIAQRRPGKPNVSAAAKKLAAQLNKGSAAAKGKAPVAPPQKLAKGAKPPVAVPEKSKKGAVPVKAVAAKAPPAKAAKPAPKKVAKPTKVAKKAAVKKAAVKKAAVKKSAAKKPASKAGAKKRSR